MHPVPHDLIDLRLAPVALELNDRLEEMAHLELPDLAHRVALDSDKPDRTRAQREEALLLSVTHLVDLRGWSIQWHDRGLRLSHHSHALVLGIPATFRQFIDSNDPPRSVSD